MQLEKLIKKSIFRDSIIPRAARGKAILGGLESSLGTLRRKRFRGERPSCSMELNFFGSEFTNLFRMSVC